MLNQDEIDKLLAAAEEAMNRAYSPYSGIKVGAALMDMDGEIHTGCNIENSSYSLTVCAERNAVFKAVSNGTRRFKGMVVVSDTSQVQSPCGACRQVLWEFNPDLQVVFVSGGETRNYSMSQLLPQAFSLVEEVDSADG